MRIETIYAQVFQIKCSRKMGSNIPRGKKKSWIPKILLGGGLTCLIILILWFPMIFFAYSTALGSSSKPAQFGLKIQFKGYEPIYSMSMEQDEMRHLTEEEWKSFKRFFETSNFGQHFLKDFDEDDVVIVKLRVDSSTTWRLSPPNLKNLIDNLKNQTQVTKLGVNYEIMLSRVDQNLKLSNGIERQINNETCQKIVAMLEKDNEESIIIENLFPQMLHLRNNGKIITLSNNLVNHRK